MAIESIERVLNMVIDIEQAPRKGERRISNRFPIERDVRYRGTRPGLRPGCGKTINISSSGVLFTTEIDIPVGVRVELSISWPVELAGGCPLKLVARGKVVRNSRDRAAIEIEKYEFRTSGMSSELHTMLTGS